MFYLSNCYGICRIAPIHKKDDKTDKESYQPISILPNLSKVYERLMYNQIYPYFRKTMFSKFQCAFRKGFNAQHCFSNGRKMVQNPRWKRWTYLWHIFWNTSKYWLRWICRWQYSLHILFKYKNLLDNLQGAFENMFHWFSTMREELSCLE